MLFEEAPESICKECGERFPKEGNLHKHLRAHSVTMGEYYVKHFPRKCLSSGQQIMFKNPKQYFRQNFITEDEELLWLSTAPKEKVKKYISQKFCKEVERSGGVMPCANQVESSYLPSIFHCARAFGAYGILAKELGAAMMFNKPLPVGFFDIDPYDMEFAIDTREQKPFSFPKSYKMKLDVGDYSGLGKDYKSTFIDRKNTQDFLSTMSATNFERFEREMERCRSLGARMFVIVESSLKECEYLKKTAKRQKMASWEYLMFNMRKMQYDFSDTCQFVFCKDREQANDMCARILFFGKAVWNSDVQYFLNQINQ